MATQVNHIELTQEQIDKLVRQAFHGAWGAAKANSDYDKKAWSYVQKYLDPAYRDPKQK